MKTKWIILGVVSLVVVVLAGIKIVDLLQTAAQRTAASEELREFGQAWLEFEIKNLCPPATLEELRPFLAAKSSRTQERADTLEVVWGALIGVDLAGPDADKRALAITKEYYAGARVYLYQNGNVRYLNDEEAKVVEKAKPATPEELAELQRKNKERQKLKEK